MPQKYSQSSFDDKENRPTLLPHTANHRIHRNLPPQKAQLHHDHYPTSLPTKKHLSIVLSTLRRQINQQILQPITSNQQFRTSSSSSSPAPPFLQPDNHKSKLPDSHHEKSLDPLQDPDIPYDHPPTPDIADINPYTHQWTFAMAPKSVSEKAFPKGSPEYLTYYLHPRCIRITFDIRRNDEFQQLSAINGHPDIARLKTTLGRHYLEPDPTRIARINRYTKSHEATQENESQWCHDIFAPLLLSGEQEPPYDLEEGQVICKTQSYLRSSESERGSFYPPNVIADADHLVLVAPNPPFKKHGDNGYYMDYDLSVKTPDLEASIQDLPYIRAKYIAGTLPPFMIVKAKADPKDMREAVQYAAWIHGGLLADRIRLQKLSSDSTFKVDKSYRTYGLHPCGAEVHVYVMRIREARANELATPNKEGHHIRYEFQCVAQFSLKIARSVANLMDWVNQIWYFGMDGHQKSVYASTDAYSVFNGTINTTDEVNRAVFRYGSTRDEIQCTIPEPLTRPTLLDAEISRMVSTVSTPSKVSKGRRALSAVIIEESESKLPKQSLNDPPGNPATRCSDDVFSDDVFSPQLSDTQRRDEESVDLVAQSSTSRRLFGKLTIRNKNSDPASPASTSAATEPPRRSNRQAATSAFNIFK